MEEEEVRHREGEVHHQGVHRVVVEFHQELVLGQRMHSRRQLLAEQGQGWGSALPPGWSGWLSSQSTRAKILQSVEVCTWREMQYEWI